MSPGLGPGAARWVGSWWGRAAERFGWSFLAAGTPGRPHCLRDTVVVNEGKGMYGCKNDHITKFTFYK